MYDLIFMESGTMKVLHKDENVKLDTAIKSFAFALANVSKFKCEIEVGIRLHDPR